MDIKQARKNVIEQQIRPWGGLNVRANQALSDIPRENFVPEEYLSLVFADIEIPLVGGAKMFSPKIEGRILDSLDIQGHETVLEIGTGSGYFTSVLAKLSQSVVTIELDEQLSELAQNKVKELNLNNITFIKDDALTYNFDNEQYDTIVIGCSLPNKNENFFRLLKPSGKLFMVVGAINQMQATLVQRTNENEWQSKSMFETHLDYMKGTEPSVKFAF
jgi:protein-L-isoaspartate(D-aspartate) O-methyltransferase|tara:strand:+ start:187 stop:840 length:654 start_codon:yes stop_codon:yes gene_type:complete